MRAPLSNHGHFLSTVEDCRPLYLPVIDLAPRGKSGMDAFAEEADSSSSFVAGFEAMFCVAWVGADATGRLMFF